MQGQCEVSIYMAAHQAEKWIGEAIESCLGQTLPPLEVIVVDDGSTDRTAEVVRAVDDPRVVLLPLTVNVGPGPARNLAMERAAGDWLAVVDADDLMCRDRLERLAHDAMTPPYRSIIIDRMTRNRAEIERRSTARGSRSLEVRDVSPLDYLREGTFSQPMFKRSLLQTGVRYRSYRAGEDTAFVIELALRSGETIRIADHKMYYYRPTPKSLSAKGEERFAAEEAMLLGMRNELGQFEGIGPYVEDRLELIADDRRVLAARESVSSGDFVSLARKLTDGKTRSAVARRVRQRLQSRASSTWQILSLRIGTWLR